MDSFLKIFAKYLRLLDWDYFFFFFLVAKLFFFFFNGTQMVIYQLISGSLVMVLALSGGYNWVQI